MKNKWVILTNQQLAGVSHAFDVETPRAVNDQSLQSLHMADHPGQTSEKHSEADKHTHITTTTILHTHAHSHNHFTALWILSGTTQVSQYQKKHSPTHTYRGHQSSLICFIHPAITIHGILPVQFTCLTVFFHNLSPSFLWSTSWPGTLHFNSIHSFTQSLSSFATHAHTIATCFTAVPRLCHLNLVSLSSLRSLPYSGMAGS